MEAKIETKENRNKKTKLKMRKKATQETIQTVNTCSLREWLET